MSAEPDGSVLLRPGRNCWRLTRADRAALLIDGAAYFAALEQALRAARHSVFIVGWDIRSEISLDPDGSATPLNRFLAQLLRARRELRVRILVWDWLVFFSLDREFLPRLQFRSIRRLRFEFDSHHPTGACQHEKIVVIDGALAFCGGLDLSAGRWDLREHRPVEPHRRSPRGAELRPFHDCMLMVEGETARGLEELARERWLHATGEQVAPAPALRPSAWPAGIEPWFEGAQVAIARTRPRFGSPARGARDRAPVPRRDRRRPRSASTSRTSTSPCRRSRKLSPSGCASRTGPRSSSSRPISAKASLRPGSWIAAATSSASCCAGSAATTGCASCIRSTRPRAERGPRSTSTPS